MGISGKQTGTWFTELAALSYILTEAGFDIVFASPNGRAAPADRLSRKAPLTTEYTQRFFNDPEAMVRNAPAVLRDVKLTSGRYLVDGALMTGQSPASALPLADALRDVLAPAA